MPFSVALLSHPAGTYAFLVLAVAGLTYGLHARQFVASFAGASAAFLAVLGFAHLRPGALGIALLAAGLASLHAEFLIATRGVAGALGLAATAYGSWAILGSGHAALPTSWRLLLALVGTAAVLGTVARALRRATLPR